MNDKIVLSNLEVIKHQQVVRGFLYRMIVELDRRARTHDQSKLESPEQEIFAESGGELSKMPYGSKEYLDNLARIQPALDHHYANNRHHPQHWPNGVDDMTLLDLCEMLADWKASTARNKDGNIRKSIEINTTRFKMSPQLAQIFENTVRELFQD